MAISSPTLSRRIDNQRMPRFITVEGPIGVGKTTLATRLSDSLGYPTMLEPAAENPFLGRFYRESRRYAMQTQLFFLLHRARMVADIADGDLIETQLVADFMMEKDRLFAELNLDENEFALYEQIYETLAIKTPKPDLVIYLQAPVPILLDRIRQRAIPSEQNMDPEYLTALAESYTKFFHYYDASPLLIVNAAEIDFASDDVHYSALLDQLKDFEGVRQYFNPHPTLV